MSETNKKTLSQKKEETRANSTWTTAKVDQLIQQMDDGYEPFVTPFWEGQTEWRAPKIVFEHTKEEYEIMKKCANDVVWFGNNYASAMTDFGIEKINLRNYQEDVMRDFWDHRFNIFLSPRQSGKCVEYGTIITVKNADTKEVFHIPIGRFYFMHLRQKDKYDYILYWLNEAKIWADKMSKCNMLGSFFNRFSI